MTDFDDGKDDGAMRTIGEVGDALDIKPHVLRYWEQQFPMLEPLKRSGGRRLYRPSDVKMIEKIDRLVNQEGYTIKGALGVLRSNKASQFDRRSDDRRQVDRRVRGEDKPRIRINQGDDRDLDEQIDRLKAIRKRLAIAIEG